MTHPFRIASAVTAGLLASTLLVAPLSAAAAPDQTTANAGVTEAVRWQGEGSSALGAALGNGTVDAASSECASTGQAQARGFWINGAAKGDSTGYAVASISDISGHGRSERARARGGDL